jgi:DNA invertase Pin-like site-specific DNA recombinase
MTTHLFALGNRARSTTAVAVLAVAAGLITAPTAAHAVSGHTQTRTHNDNQAKVARDPRPSATQRSGAPATTGRNASRFLTQPSRNRFGSLAIAAAFATLIGAPLALLLYLERRRRYRAGSTESFLRAALATAVTEAARLKQPPDRTVRLVDQVDTAAPVSIEAADARVWSGALEATRERSGRKLREIDVPPRERTAHRVDQADGAAPGSAGTTEVQRSRPHVSAGKRVIGYVTVPADPGSNEARTSSDAIEAACERSGWKLLEIVRDRENGRILERPGLHYALQRIANGKARGLVVGELQSLSRSIVDLGALMAWFRDTQATLIALDLGIDTSTPEGHHVATTLIALSNWEHERIANRTRSGLAEVRANGHPTGRPAVSDRPELVQRIAAMRAANMTLQAIADQLNDEQIPTLRGGRKWRPSSIQAALGYRRPGPRDHLPSPQKRGPS